jgi:hypothetical protein
MRCPRCGTGPFRIARTPMNLARAGASALLLPFYLLGGLAGDDRGPILPLEHHCDACGLVVKGRSVFDHFAVWTSRGRRDPSS